MRINEQVLITIDDLLMINLFL